MGWCPFSRERHVFNLKRPADPRAGLRASPCGWEGKQKTVPSKEVSPSASALPVSRLKEPSSADRCGEEAGLPSGGVVGLSFLYSGEGNSACLCVKARERGRRRGKKKKRSEISTQSPDVSCLPLPAAAPHSWHS